MDERIKVLIDIVLDDDRFLQYIRENAGLGESAMKKIEIPKHSFTSHQLTYCSAVEISQSHRSVLIGGIPQIWNLQHSYNIFTIFERLTDVRLRNRIKYVYEKGRGKETRFIHWRQYHSADKNKAFDENVKPSKLVTVYDDDDNDEDDGEASLQNGSLNSPSVVQQSPSGLTSDAHRGNDADVMHFEDPLIGHDGESTVNSDLEEQSLEYNEAPTDFSVLDDNETRSLDVRTYTLNKENANQRLIFRHPTRQTFRSFTSRRSSLNSKDPLKILKPIPQPITREEQTRINNSHAHYTPFKAIGKKISAVVPDAHFGSFWEKPSPEHNRITLDSTKIGKIIKMEKMIVMVKQALTARVIPPHFSEDEPVDTRIYERWKEYFVVARGTGNPDAPVRLQLYTSRKIKPIVTKDRKPWHCKIQFDLDKKCLVEFYNSLDKSICIVKQDDLLTQEMRFADNAKTKTATSKKQFSPLKIFIFRCDNLLSSSRWLVFLRSSIGPAAQPCDIDIHIPIVNLSLNVDLPEIIRRKLAKKAAEEEEVMKIFQLENGYRVAQLPILRYLKLVIRETLIQLGYLHEVKKWDASNILMGLCWKHYDRIEWSYGNQTDLLYGTFVLRKSHIFEYRRLKTYPRSIQKPIDNHTDTVKVINEPSPIEGFLSENNIVFSDKNEYKLSHPYFKLSYWFTSNGLFFRTRSVKATPPLPEDDVIDPFGVVLDKARLDDLIETMPRVYEDNPYPLDENGHFAWLNENITTAEFESHDARASRSFLRKISLILKADNCIDLTRCTDIKLLDASGFNIKTMKIWNEANNMVWKNSQTLEATKSSIIELVIGKNVSKLLMAPDPETCQEWLSRLREIAFYWKRRLAADRQLLWDLKIKNLNTFNITELQEKHISAFVPKWMTELSTTNDHIYNVSAHALSRPIIHQGLIYHKSRKHSVFNKHFMVLIPGFIMLYHCFDRSIRGYAKDSTKYRHFLTIPIEKCYLYSGALSEQELLDRDKHFNSINPGSHSLSRVYADGWKSMDEESSRTFVMWFPNKRIMLSSVITPETPDSSKFHVVDKLGVSGKSMIFMCRSRQERDLWMVKIYDELERVKML